MAHINIFSWLPLFHLLLNLLHIWHLHNIWRFSKQTNPSNILEVMWSAPYNFGGFLRRQAHKLAAPPKCQNLETKFIFVESECHLKKMVPTEPLKIPIVGINPHFRQHWFSQNNFWNSLLLWKCRVDSIVITLHRFLTNLHTLNLEIDNFQQIQNATINCNYVL